ncbi:MAG: hypothetical protein JWP78_332 [Mucilaginibacter sp.]|nr:hypothetical protein [Mucilaginibacter sp.]
MIAAYPAMLTLWLSKNRAAMYRYLLFKLIAGKKLSILFPAIPPFYQLTMV